MDKNFLTCFFACLFALLNIQAQAPYGNAGDHTPVPFGSIDAPFGYYEYLPQNFSNSSGETYPVVLFYHGFGERGNGTSDLNDILLLGPPKLIQQGVDFESIVISPQNSDANYSATDFLNLYNYIIANYPVDLDRFYVTGISSGGGSTWRALQGHSDKIAASVPICGTDVLYNPSDFLQQTPIWTFHSFDDSVINLNSSVSNVNDIANISNSVMSVYPYGSGNSAANQDYSMLFDDSNETWTAISGSEEPNSNLSFTIYNNGGHDSWTRTYNNQNVWDWLFAQNRNILSNADKNILDFSIYPNPASNDLTIQSTDNSEKQVELYNLLGRKMYSNRFTENHTIDVSQYASGMYLAKVIKGAQEKIIKIVVN